MSGSTAYAVVDETGAVVAKAASKIGAFRKIAAASDERLSWRDVADHFADHDELATSVAGGPTVYQIVAWADVEETDPR